MHPAGDILCGVYIFKFFYALREKSCLALKILYIIKTNEGAKWAYRQAKWINDHCRDVEFVVLMPKDNIGMAKKYKEEGIRVLAADLSLPIKKPWNYFKQKKQINLIVKKEKPDLIHVHFVTNILFLRFALRKTDIPRLFQVPGPLHLEKFLFRKAEILSSNSFDYWAGACQKTCDIYLKNNIPKDRVFLCYYGDDIDKISKSRASSDFRKEYNIDDSTKIIAMVSYFYKPKRFMMQFRGLKGHEDFIDAFSEINKRVHNTVAVIVGGPWGNSCKYMEKVKRYAKNKCGDKVIFTGFRDDVFGLYKEFDVAVHPSLSENLGGALESLASGTPTVSTNIGGFPDIIVNSVSGLLVPKRNPHSISEDVIKIISNPKLAKKMSENGFKIVKEKCDISVTAKNVYECYKKILNRTDVNKFIK